MQRVFITALIAWALATAGIASGQNTWKPTRPVAFVVGAALGPKGMTRAQVAFWEDALAKAVKSEEWQKTSSATSGRRTS